MGNPASSNDATMRTATRSRNEYGAVGSVAASDGTTTPVRRHASSWAVVQPENRDAWIAVYPN